MDQGRDEWWCSWYGDLVSEARPYGGVLLLMDADHQTATRTNFLDVGEGGLEQLWFVGSGEEGQLVRVVIDQGNRTVFEKAPRHSFRM